MTPEQRDKYLKAIQKIEQAKRPEKWRLIRKLVLELKPWLVDVEREHSEACKELRSKNENKFASSKSGDMRNSMKLFGPVYTAMLKADPDLTKDTGRQGDQLLIHKQLWEAFPEYRICREL